MNYTKLYEEYFNKLITSRKEGKPSIMYPPDYNGDEVNNLPEDTSTVIFTTGTTGKPKGVIHSFSSIENAIKTNTEILSINGDDILMNFLPTWTIGTYIYAVPTYESGGRIIHDKFSVEKLKEYLQQGPTITLLIPTMIDMMMDSGEEFDLSGIRNVGIGAEEVHIEHMEYILDCGAGSVTHMYGSSEAIPLCLYNTFSSKEEITLGMLPVHNVTYYYTKPGDPLLLQGPSVSTKYVGGESNEWYNTKDEFAISKKGLYEWQRRTDQIIKKKGWKAVEDREYDIFEKEFSPDLDPSTLIWHTDDGDREVTILEVGKGWFFEVKGKSPRLITKGSVVYVSKRTVHRIVKGDGGLKVRIKQYR